MKTSDVLTDIQHSLAVGGSGLPGDHDHTDSPDYAADPSHDVSEGESFCSGCGMRATWPGIEDTCRAKTRSRAGIPLGSVPSIFALVWQDFSLWWEENHGETGHAPTVDEWLHQMMEFRKIHRRAKDSDDD